MGNRGGFTTDLIIQYSIVGLVLLGACLWIILKLIKKQKKNEGGCCGCSIADSCKKKNDKKWKA